MAEIPLRFFDPTGEIRKSGGGLPHWEQEGACYFITFRLADSLPVGKLAKWKEERAAWVEENPQPWTEDIEAEYHRVFSMKVERWLDQGMGECWMRNAEVRSMVLEKMMEGQGEEFFIHNVVLMPNHVHVLVSISKGSLPNLMKNWKGGTAFLANQELERNGEFWQRDYFDRIIRDGRHFQRCRRYIAANPAKAGLSGKACSFWEAGETVD